MRFIIDYMFPDPIFWLKAFRKTALENKVLWVEDNKNCLGKSQKKAGEGKDSVIK